MLDLKGKSVLVTGAASGIGRETALAFAREGSLVIACDIDEERLAGLSRELGSDCVGHLTRVLDVSDPVAVANTASALEREGRSVDVLINNAGVFIWGNIGDTTLDDWRWITSVNLMGPVHMIDAFLPQMIKRGSGHILNIASAGGLIVMPAIGAYAATKHAVVGLSETLRIELARKGIGVTAFCPGSTKTPIFSNIRIRGLNRHKLETRIFPVANTYSAAKTALKIVDAVRKNKALVVTTAPAKLLFLLYRLSPALYLKLLEPSNRIYERYRA